MSHRSENSSFHGGQNSAAKWVPDTLKRNCEICNAKFSKFFKRRHHCRQCGAVVCDPCSNVKDYVSGYKDRKVRICSLCNAGNLEMKKVVQNAKKNMVMSAATIKNIPPKKK
jgi:predicted nucleic acid-binding Zn ribbon protein